MKVVKRNVYVSEFCEWGYFKRLSYVWINLFLGEIKLSSTLNPLDWTLRCLIVDIFILLTIIPFVTLILIPASFFEAKLLKTRYVDNFGWYIENEYVLE